MNTKNVWLQSYYVSLIHLLKFVFLRLIRVNKYLKADTAQSAILAKCQRIKQPTRCVNVHDYLQGFQLFAELSQSQVLDLFAVLSDLLNGT